MLRPCVLPLPTGAAAEDVDAVRMNPAKLPGLTIAMMVNVYAGRLHHVKACPIGVRMDSANVAIIRHVLRLRTVASTGNAYVVRDQRVLRVKCVRLRRVCEWFSRVPTDVGRSLASTKPRDHDSAAGSLAVLGFSMAYFCESTFCRSQRPEQRG